ncbi:MAG: T9SS type A sorting domain-containing protein [Chlorobiota bacterium]
MKLALKIILFIFPIVVMSQSFYKLTHYNVLNSHLKTKCIEGDNFLLYGYAGGVLRTTDSGENWEQAFSGTHETISKVVITESGLIGVTFGGEFMVSTDGGDKWEVKKISSSPLTDIYSDNGLIYISQISDSIMVSADGGNTWNSEFVISDTLNGIFVKNNELIVNSYRNKLLKKDVNRWSRVDLPEKISFGVSYGFKTTESDLYVIGLGDIYKLKDDLYWESYKIGDIYFDDFLETKDSIITLQSNPINESIDLVYYDKSDMSVINTESIIDSNLTNYNFQSTGIDISDNRDIIVTAIGKTIFVKKNNSDWETKSSYEYIYGFTFQKYLNENELRFLSLQNGNFQWTNDGGTTFKQGTRQFGRKNGDVLYWNYITKDSLNVIIRKEEESKLAVSSNAGKTFEFTEIDVPIYDYSIYEKNEEHTIYTSLGYRNQSTTKKFLRFYKEENGVLDTLFELDSVYKTMNYENKILLIQDMNSNQEFEFYLTDENLTNPELVYTIKYEYDLEKNRSLSIKSVRTDQDGNILIFFSRWPKGVPGTLSSVYKISDFEEEAEIVMEEKAVHFYFPDNYQIGSDKFVTIGSAPDEETPLDFYFAIIDLSEGFDYEIVGESDIDFMQPQYTEEDGILLFERRTQNLWRPIEPDRIPTSVSIEATPPPIWTYPPYPNPTRDKISVAFYSGVMSDVNELEISIINIATGVVTEVEPTNLNILNNWNGKIDIDVSSYNSGQYMIEFKLKDKKSVEKFIINR